MDAKPKAIFKSHSGRERTMEEFVVEELDGSEYDRGELETMRAEIKKTVEAFAGLLQTLSDKGVLNDVDVFKVVKGFVPKGVLDE